MMTSPTTGPSIQRRNLWSRYVERFRHTMTRLLDPASLGQPARQLTFEDAILVWHLHWAGELNHRIAARLDTNQGRVSEVLAGTRQPGSRAAAQRRLLD